MEPTTQTTPKVNPLLEHLKDEDESHASTRVDFLHPGTIVQPAVAAPTKPASKKDQSPLPPPEVPVPPTPPPPPGAPPAPKSPHNNRPIIIGLIILLVLLLAGGGTYWYFKSYRPSHNQTSQQPAQTVPVTAVAPTDLAQKDASTQTLATGALTKNPLELDFTMTTSANSGSVEPQVEVQPVGTAFTGQPNYKGSSLTATGGNIAAKVAVTDLHDGSYHWQARFAVGDSTSDWVAYGANAETVADFMIDSTAPVAAQITTVGSKTVAKGATSLSTTDNHPTIAGTAEVGATVSVAIAPDNQTGTATVDASGKWTIGISQDLANGDHTVTITVADGAGNRTASTFTISVNTATAAPATTQIAPTGDNTAILTLLGLVLAIGATTGLILVTKIGRDQV
ncbi:MAG TPA: Ig-like domain-containing protein [Candidatus Saccharimonadales bacterium]|nr:Ig-like domain-containing protein [Candidatus Saccharimonadales bacterium]